MEAIVEKLDYEGRGIIRVSNKVVFLPRALPHEKISYHLVKDEKRYSIGIIDKVLSKSSFRLASFCPYANHCGGCTFDIVSYEQSLKFKKDIFCDYANHNQVFFPDVSIVESRPVLGYRNKVSFKVENGQYGYYEEESHQFVPIKNCYLAMDSIQCVLNDFSYFSFRQGSLTIRSNNKNEILLEIETSEEPQICEELVIKHNIAGIIWNKKCVYGKAYFIEERDSIQYFVSYDSFFQVNQDISEKIKQDILTFFHKEDQVLDLYCGVGFFTLPLAKKVSFVTGIEEGKNAIISANKNAMMNQITNVSFHCGKVENILEKIPIHYNKAVLDPPRAGLKRAVIRVLLKSDIKNIVYVSCNYFTMIRDLKLLQEKYEIHSLKLYDMFPYTKHVECVVLLCLKDSSDL